MAQVLLERFENAPGGQRSTSLHEDQRIGDGLWAHAWRELSYLFNASLDEIAPTSALAN